MKKQMSSLFNMVIGQLSTWYIYFMYSMIIKFSTTYSDLGVKVTHKDIIEKISREGIFKSVKYIAMPTRMGASIIKEKYPNEFASYIKKMTKYYLKLAFLFTLFLFIADNLEHILDWLLYMVDDKYVVLKFFYTDNFILNIILFDRNVSWVGFAFGFALILISFSRIFEIFYAFYRDAFTHLKSDKEYKRSNLEYSERVHLAMYSYIELILLFGFVYYAFSAISATWTLSDHAFQGNVLNIIDSIYFSGVTITTLGYGDISPNIMLNKLLVIFEVLSGFTLIIVSFTIYVSRAITEIDLGKGCDEKTEDNN